MKSYQKRSLEKITGVKLPTVGMSLVRMSVAKKYPV